MPIVLGTFTSTSTKFVVDLSYHALLCVDAMKALQRFVALGGKLNKEGSLKTHFCFIVWAVYLVKKVNHIANDEMSNYPCPSEILIPIVS